MKTDIEIAQEAAMLPIKDVAASIGVKKTTLNYTVSIKQNFQMNI